MSPAVATESMMQLNSVYSGRWDERKKWGYHIPSSWQLFFDTGRAIGQIQGDFKTEDVVKNDWIDTANSFDAAKIKADADGFKLSDAYAAVDMDKVKANL
jgi:NitT/TauT family transport system substrate-binding protein